MAVWEDDLGTVVRVEPSQKAARSVIAPRGDQYCTSAITGVIAAGLAVNSTLFAMRLDPGSPRVAYIERFRVQYTCLTGFTTPITAARRLALFRASGAATTGGLSIGTAYRKDSVQQNSEFDTAQGGDLRIANTGSLVASGITFETVDIRTMSLAHVGNAGNFYDMLFEFHATECAPLVLQPGQLLVLRNPVAMDAGGTFQLVINADWYEAEIW